MRESLFVFIACMFSTVSWATPPYYVDCNAGSSGDGTYASPWNSVADVNSASLSTGDDVYFKQDTICELHNTTGLDIDWNGSSGNPAIIGCYEADGDFDCSGQRPIIDGNGTSPTTEKGLISSNGNTGGNIVIRDLRVNHSNYYGMLLKNSGNNNRIENCYVFRSEYQGIVLGRVNDSTVTRCTVNESGYLRGAQGGAGIVTVGTGYADNNTISYNRVFNVDECINCGSRKATGTICEYNEVYNCSATGIYVDASKYSIIRHNLVYTSSDFGVWPDPMWVGIFVDNENGRGYCFTGGTEIYGNLVAYVGTGIRISNEYQRKTDGTCTQDNHLIYANTVVDSIDYSFAVRHGNNMGGGTQVAWTGNEIRNNVSYTLSSDSAHVFVAGSVGAAWSHNLFDEAVGGAAATDAVIGDPRLVKSSGWRALTAGAVDGTEFAVELDSPAIDAGIPVVGHDARIYASDFTADPIAVSTAVDDVPDIGAWMYAVPVTCADLGGADCCTGSQTCPGTDLGVSSDCADVCCSEMCTAPTCQGQGYQCCDACGSGAHPQYDGDCPGQVCCEACEVCSDGTCNGSETCQSCPQDCPTGAGEVCCSGVIYTGDCCEDGDCTAPDTCVGHVCTPACNDGDSRACYEGPAGTEGVGVCRGGTRTCSGGAWGDCAGQVLPSVEVCDDTVDNDCNGLVDGADPECTSCSADVDCHDENLCNGEESCSAGACQPGTPLDCDDGDPCTDDRCVPATGCEHTPDTSAGCADDEPKGSCGCGFGAPGPGEAGLELLLLFMLAFALHDRLYKSRSKMLGCRPL